MIVRALATLVLTLVPAVASACPSCLFSPYGDRTFNWAFLGLLAMPFVVIAGIGGALFFRYRALRTPRDLRRPSPEVAHFAAPEERP